ncbi:MAG: M67 family metallopeptidase [Anaerolineales bacterium]|jgi:proteasome lid subunit RPN8/RPN11
MHEKASSMRRLSVNYNDWLAMQRHVESKYPLEACGMVGAQAGLVKRVIPIENVLLSNRRYKMHPAEQVKAVFDLEHEGLDLAAIYHSHPDGSTEPSAIEVSEWNYKEALCLIWSKQAGSWICSAYKLDHKTFVSVKLEIIPYNRSPAAAEIEK